MKKTIAIFLAAILLLSLAACGKEEDQTPQQITISTAPREETAVTEAAPTETAAASNDAGEFAFVWEGVTLVPGADFDASALPEAASVYTVPSCAIEGTDNVYNYEAFEVTAFDTGSGESIYSVYLLDPNITTPEGLALGDPVSRVTELYGEDYATEGTAMVYTGGNTRLYVITGGDAVVSIEYRLVTD